MADIIAMPKLSDTMEEGVIANWVVKKGDSISEGDLLCEIETDKATMDYECPADGTVLEIIAKPGVKVAVGSAICVVGEAGEKYEVSKNSGSEQKSQKNDDGEDKAAKPKEEKKNSKPESKAVVEQASTGAVHSSGDGERIKASPLAKKMAADKGIDLAQVHGSGPKGRIIAGDLSAASTQGGTRQKASLEKIPSVGNVSPEDHTQAVSMMRQTIAKRLVSGKNEAPHFYLSRTVEMDAALALRANLNNSAAEAQGCKISVNDLVLIATARALRVHPEINASWQGETILIRGSVDVAIAVALPGGLITPVIRNCDHLGLWTIAKQARDLAKKAKANQLKPEEYIGGSFTVSNLGMFGIDHFTAIINPPQAAILAVGGIRKEFVPDEKGQPKIVQRMTLTLSCDHRVIDGAMGAQFMQTLASYLDNPALMLG